MVMIRSQTLFTAGPGEGMHWNEETSWGDGNVLYLVLGGGRFIQLLKLIDLNT